MQIVRDLAGYSYGRSDLVRRAMSKKKAAVMEKERKNFVYGNADEGVKGCVANGIPEDIANKIYDEMIDFAKYAFNKSHAAAYAVVSYQTAFLKCYYPVEFMAALMTSVMDNPKKVAEYIYTCRQMGIELLAPDVNVGESAFSVDKGKIRYGLAAIKGVGKPVIEALVAEREQNGSFKSLRDFAERLSGKEVNKRTVESFIKSGAFDSLYATRKQMMLIYTSVLDDVSQERKKSITGQMSLFDFLEEDDKISITSAMPDVGEFAKEELLAYEKEMLGVYLSGHPLEAYEGLLVKNVTALTTDFEPEEENGEPKKRDGELVRVGGMITEITRKTTRTNSMMAFLTLEDLVGTVEVIVFPKDYEKYKEQLREDNKVFIKGRVSADEERAAKLVCSEVLSFDEVPRELWIRYKNKDAFQKEEAWLYETLRAYDGKNTVVIYCEEEKVMKRLPKNYAISIEESLVFTLNGKYGKEYIKVVEKSIEK